MIELDSGSSSPKRLGEAEQSKAVSAPSLSTSPSGIVQDQIKGQVVCRSAHSGLALIERTADHLRLLAFAETAGQLADVANERVTLAASVAELTARMAEEQQAKAALETDLRKLRAVYVALVCNRGARDARR